MRVNAVRIVVPCNGSVAKRKLMQVWRHGRLLLVQITTRDLGLPAQRRIAAGRVLWPLSEVSWEGALNRGRRRGPIRNLRHMADRLTWIPT
eukprot:3398361-Amphidinium_carterae.2